MATTLTAKQLQHLIEAAIFSAAKPLSVTQLLETVLADTSVTREQAKQALSELQRDYRSRGIELVKLASGYRFQTRPELAKQLNKVRQNSAPKYSRALLETLALIAYQQPITRGEIETVRGVSVSSQSIRTLTERGWIKVVGHKEVPGRPALLATTKGFLDYFGLASLSELPKLSDETALQALLVGTSSRQNKELVNE
nr:SMC-Scp complex subunit ScpB [Paraferrimonas haliotis]